jgi:nitroimidazol reductase NimA-like FMN-containing flavoprotein (pyridoxamine 5'-phosphate oxidase superfamily)
MCPDAEAEMRRNDKKIEDPAEIEAILREAPVCRIGLADGDVPYVVPMNFGCRGRSIYLHSAPEGRKIDIISRNGLVCFQADTDIEIVRGETACSWGARYRCVIGYGRAEFVTDREEKRAGLDAIMEKYSGKPGWSYGDASLEKIALIRIDLTELTGKRSGW